MKPLILIIRWWWLWLLCVIVSSFPAAFLFDRLGWIEFEYESRAVIEIRPIVEVNSKLGESLNHPTHQPITHGFMQPNFGGSLFPPETISKAINDKVLLHRLGGDQVTALKTLGKSVATKPIKGTNRIEIFTRGTDGILARDISLALIDAYSKRRNELEMAVRKEHLKANRIELQNKNDRVNELQHRLEKITSRYGLLWSVKELSKGKGLRVMAEERLYVAQLELDALTTEMNRRLLERDSDAGNPLWQPSDEKYLQLLEALKQVKRKLARLVGEKHPDRVRLEAEVRELSQAIQLWKQQIGTDGELLRSRLSELLVRVQKLRSCVNAAPVYTPEGEFIRHFDTARMEYLASLAVRDKMKKKYLAIKENITPSDNVVIVEPPKFQKYPAGYRSYLLAGLLALPISSILGIFLMRLAERRFPRKPSSPDGACSQLQTEY